MPVPTPEKGETQKDFQSRCMGDKTLYKEYPNAPQRNAICFAQWDKAHPENPHKKPKSMAGEDSMDMKSFQHNSTTDESEPQWGSVDKTKLPRVAHADEGTADQKSSWRFPHHWVKDGGGEDANGVYTTGTMLLHEGGLNAAWSAANGGRSGQEASAAIKSHLNAHRSAIDAEEKSESPEEEKKEEAGSTAELFAFARTYAPVPLAQDVLQDTASCWTSHLGIWAIEELWFTQAIELFKHGLYNPPAYSFYAERFRKQGKALSPEQRAALKALDMDMEAYAPANDKKPYMLQDGIAMIPVEGPITKGRSKFGGASTLDIQRAVRAAVRDGDVKSIMMLIDSPGGSVSGIQALADDVHRAGMQKPVRAHVEDLGASAAYWIASQAHHITANPTAEVGSIGTMAVVEDSSKRMDRLGIQVHVISTGPYKGLGAEGTPIPASAMPYLQDRVNSVNEHFMASVQRGRKRLSPDELKNAADGRVYIARVAKQLGLIDGVVSFDEAFDLMHGLNSSSSASSTPGRRAAHALALDNLVARFDAPPLTP